MCKTFHYHDILKYTYVGGQCTETRIITQEVSNSCRDMYTHTHTHTHTQLKNVCLFMEQPKVGIFLVGHLWSGHHA